MTMLRRSLPPIARQLSISFCEIKPKTLCILSALEGRTKFSLQKPSPTLTTTRNYAKGKDKKKDKKKNLTVNENELGEFFEIDKLYKDMNGPLEAFKKHLIDHTTLRTSHGAIHNLKIQYEGNMHLLQDLAEISMKNPKLYVLDFSLFPEAVTIAMDMFKKSDLNLNVQQEGLKIIVPVPKVTKEHRELLVKKAKTYFVKCKDSVKEVQFKYIKKLKNTQNLSEESKFRITDQLTALGNQYIDTAEKILKEKNEELLKTE